MLVHGAVDHAELAALGLAADEVLDFSSNLNPFGPPASVRQALAQLDPAPYPDRSCLRLRQALAERHRCDPAHILVGNGSNELIHLIAHTLLRPNERVLVIGPTFGEYAHACRLAGARVDVYCAGEAASFQLDVKAVVDAIATRQPRMIWLCVPNNPTGRDLPPAAIATIAAACAAHDSLLVVDRAYQDLRRTTADMQPEHCPLPHVLWLHSLTKSYAIAGLRVGYLRAAPDSVAKLATAQPTWSVSSAAQAGALAALGDEHFLAASIPQLWALSDNLALLLEQRSLPVQRDALPFLLVRTGDGAATRRALLEQGMLVRDCASFGLPAWVRVAPRLEQENLRLVRAWSTLL